MLLSHLRAAMTLPCLPLKNLMVLQLARTLMYWDQERIVQRERLLAVLVCCSTALKEQQRR